MKHKLVQIQFEIFIHHSAVWDGWKIQQYVMLEKKKIAAVQFVWYELVAEDIDKFYFIK